MNTKVLRKIYDRTSGKCHLCRKKLAFINYGKTCAKAPWEVDHSIPKAIGGKDHINNYYAACPSCNRSKGKQRNQTIRRKNGFTKPPLSVKQKNKIRRNNERNGAVIGGLAGLIFGPWGVVLGAGVGTLVGNTKKITE